MNEHTGIRRRSMEGSSSGGEASPEAQVRYLTQVVKTKDDEIETLKLELRTKQLEGDVERAQVERGLDAIEKLRAWHKEQLRSLPSEIPVRTKRFKEPDMLQKSMFFLAFLLLGSGLVLMSVRAWMAL